MTKFVGYPRDRETPTRFFSNDVVLETTLFTTPVFWRTKTGREHATAKVCFRGYTWAENGIDKIPSGRIGMKISAVEDAAIELARLSEGDRVVLSGYIITEDFQTDMGELKTTLTLLVRSLGKTERVWDRSEDNFREKG